MIAPVNPFIGLHSRERPATRAVTVPPRCPVCFAHDEGEEALALKPPLLGPGVLRPTLPISPASEHRSGGGVVTSAPLRHGLALMALSGVIVKERRACL